MEWLAWTGGGGGGPPADWGPGPPPPALGTCEICASPASSPRETLMSTEEAV